MIIFDCNFTYHLLVWKAATDLSSQVLPMLSSLRAKHYLFPGSLNKDKRKKNISETCWKLILNTNQNQKQKSAYTRPSWQWHEVTWSSPALIQQLHLLTPWEASQSLFQYWKKKDNCRGFFFLLIRSCQKEQHSLYQQFIYARSNRILPLCSRPADNCFFIFQSNQQMFCKIKMQTYFSSSEKQIIFFKKVLPEAHQLQFPTP